MPAPSPDHVALPFLGGRVDIAERAQVRNPANWDEVVGHVALAGAPQVDAAVTLAADSLSAWPALPAVDRAEHLLLAAAALESSDREARARLLTREHGKVLWESTLDVSGATAILRYHAALAERFDTETEHLNAAGTARVRRRPMGMELGGNDGLDPDTHIGPLTTAAQRAKVRRLVEDARSHGAQVAEVGRQGATAHWDNGAFMRPVVVSDVHPDAPLVTEEQFGPAAPILPFRDDDAAVALANAGEYGLAASVWSADPAHADAVARRIDTGSVFVNAHRLGASDLEMPFGGMKHSGLGRRHGFIAAAECSELQTIAHVTDPSALPGPTSW